MSFYICSNCGYGSAFQMGKCPDCSEWNTFKKQADPEKSGGSRKKESVATLATKSFSEVAELDIKRMETGLFEFDRVLGGGLVKGEVVLLTGEPGIGKSTLLLQSLKQLSTLYISGEESAAQVKDRALRLQIDTKNFLFSDTLQVEGIVAGLKELTTKPQIIVIDSIQTVYTKSAEGSPGSVTQLKECAAQLTRVAKELGIAMIIVGHITKDGDIAGPKMLEHLVDCVLAFEGEKISHFRVLRAQKNRFGSTDEIGIFEMKGSGLAEVSNAMAFIEDDTTGNVPGKAVVGVMEGKRPLFFEIQSLAVPTGFSMPRRVAHGVEFNKLLLILAVIRKHLRIDLEKYDIFVNVVGGVDVNSPAADLGILAAIVSSVKDVPITTKLLCIGEVGLLGEVRTVFSQERITAEAKRLGFTKVLSSESVKSVKELSQKLFN